MYFGKTTKPDPYKYHGSGTYWTRHIKKHGKEHIITLWVSDLYFDTSITKYALHFSYENAIVESKDWANLIPENGLDGTVPGTNFSDKTKANMSAAKQNPSNERRKQMSETMSRTNKTRIKENNPNYGIPSKLKGIPRTQETKNKISKKLKGIVRTIPKSQHQIDILIKRCEKQYKIYSPNNEILIITNMTKFCKENNLDPGNMFKVANGFKPSYKGWVCEHYTKIL